MIRNRDDEIISLYLDAGFVFQRVADKDDTLLTGFPVDIFPLAIGSDIPVEDINIHFRVDLFQFQCIVDGMGTTDLGAVRPFRFSGTDTLDKNCRGYFLERRILIHEFSIEIQACQNSWVIPIVILCRFQSGSTGCHYSYAVFQIRCGIAGSEGRFEISHESVYAGKLCVQVYLDIVVPVDI